MIALLLAACVDESPPAQPAPATEAAAVPSPPPPPPLGVSEVVARLEPLQGRWNSRDDPRAQVLILKSLWMEGYDGVEQSRSVLEWADGCRADGGKPSPTGAYLNHLSEKPRCMQLGVVTRETLELVELPEGRSLHYVRASGGM